MIILVVFVAVACVIFIVSLFNRDSTDKKSEKGASITVSIERLPSVVIVQERVDGHPCSTEEDWAKWRNIQQGTRTTMKRLRQIENMLADGSVVVTDDLITEWKDKFVSCTKICDEHGIYVKPEGSLSGIERKYEKWKERRQNFLTIDEEYESFSRQFEEYILERKGQDVQRCKMINELIQNTGKDKELVQRSYQYSIDHKKLREYKKGSRYVVKVLNKSSMEVHKTLYDTVENKNEVNIEERELQTEGRRIENCKSSYTVFDLETTGLSPQSDAIIEIAAVKVRNGMVVEEFSSLVNPGCSIPSAASAVNGIYDYMVADAPHIKSIMEKFVEFVGDDVLVGHNIHTFDMKFIRRDSIRYLDKAISNNYLDTLYLARKSLPEIKHHRLSDLAEYYDIPDGGAHRALADCKVNQKVFERLREPYALSE